MKVIMYHYVQRYNVKYPNFRFLDFNNFKKQLDYFEHMNGFVKKDEWLNFVNNGVLPKKNGKVILTFDDGLKVHYDYVFPELKKRNLFAFFFIPTFPYTKKKILDVHRIHLLCGAFSGKELIHKLLKLIDESMIPDIKIKAFRNQTYTNQNNEEGVVHFKRLLNYYIDYKYRTKIIDELCSSFKNKMFVKDFYMNPHNIKEIFSHGNFIGSHSVDHPVMSKLNKRQQLRQIKSSFDYLSSCNVIDIKTYCHPYGGFHSFNTTTINLLKKESVNYSFNVESREIVGADYKKNMHSLPRFDCNLFKFGKAS